VAQVRAGTVQARSSAELFGEYARRVIAERPGLGRRTRDKYVQELRLYLSELVLLRVDRVSAAQLRAIYAALRDRGLSEAVRLHAHNVAYLVLETARLDGLIARNPAAVAGVRPKRERGSVEAPRALTQAEAARFLRAARDVTHGDVLAFLLLTGMRKGEALGLRWSVINVQQQIARIVVTRSKTYEEQEGSKKALSIVYEGTPKTARSRRDVPLGPQALALLQQTRTQNETWQRQQPQRTFSDHVFVTIRGGGLYPDGINAVMKQVLDRADHLERERSEAAGAPFVPITRVSVHGLRHTFVSLAAAQGERLEKIARVIGDDPQTVMKIYLHVFKENMTAPALNIGSFTED
jgi:integrase